MDKEKVIKIVKDFLDEAEADTYGDYMSKIWSKDFGLDDIDMGMLTFEIEEAFSTLEDSPEIVIRDEAHAEKLVNSTIEELVSFFLSELEKQ